MKRKRRKEETLKQTKRWQKKENLLLLKTPLLALNCKMHKKGKTPR